MNNSKQEERKKKKNTKILQKILQNMGDERLTQGYDFFFFFIITVIRVPFIKLEI